MAKANTACADADCERPARSSAGLCLAHYSRRRRERLIEQATPCGVEGCTRTGMTAGLCYAHYQRKRRQGDTGAALLRSELPKATCSIDGCADEVHARDLCGTHYMRLLTTGDAGEARLAAASARSPLQVGNRTLVAKTCTLCGLLLDREWFSDANNGRPHGQTYCRKCQSDRQDRDAAAGRGRAYQAVTVGGAFNSRKEWTEADYRILTDPTKSWAQKAAELGRTHYALKQKVRKIGHAIPRGGFPSEGEWRIFWDERQESGRALDQGAES